MPRSVPFPANTAGTRASISAEIGARLVRIGTTIVETSAGGGARRGPACRGGGADGAAHAKMSRTGNNVRVARALNGTIMSDTTTRGIRIEVESEYLADR